MKKLIITGLVAALALAPITAEAGKKKKKKNTAHQEQTGTIALPAPADPVDTVCNSGAHRRINVYAQGQVNGVVGYHFEVDPATEGLPFRIDVVSGDNNPDLDINFYAGFGDPADPAGAPSNISFEERKPGGEYGEVPPGFPLVIVCAYSGTQIEFEYEARAGLKPPA